MTNTSIIIDSLISSAAI